MIRAFDALENAVAMSRIVEVVTDPDAWATLAALVAVVGLFWMGAA